MTAERQPDTVAATTEDGRMPLRIGSLFAGYGGLDLGLETALGDTEPAWFSEIDDAPSRVLAHHWPDVPNLGDITAIDWATVEPVDVLTGGFPCQDVSLAGLRRGLHPDTRSGLWSHFALAIDALRPPLVIVENVRGLLSAQAASNLEPDAWDLGDRNIRPPLRALGAVLGDLAELGYDARWAGVRAADAGAPHGRFRVFVIAHPHPEREPRDQRRQPAPRPEETGRTRPDPRRRGRTSAPDPHRNAGTPAGPLGSRGMGSVESGTGLPRDRDRERTPRDRAPERGDPSPDADRGGLGSFRRLNPEQHHPDRRDRPHPAWGAYEPAVRRWEHITQRTAPNPTTPGPTGGQRLSPVFVEWMMGLPEGHVTDPAIGLTRNEQLKALGNGVVPQQAALALRTLLAATAPEPIRENA